MTYSSLQSLSFSPLLTTYVFIFAHQDDELFAFPIFRSLSSQGVKPYVLYMTSGCETSSEARVHQREQESLRFFTQIGLSRSNIIFLGNLLGINDGQLYLNFSRCFLSLTELISSIKPLYSLTFITHAYEGGHPDHDACNIIVTKLNHVFSNSQTFSIPFYRSCRMKIPPYILLAPLTENGSFLRYPFPRSYLSEFIRCSLFYKSQWLSMLMLVPFAVLRLAILPYLPLHYQPSSYVRLRPMSARTFSESRFKLDWALFSQKVEEFLKS